MIDLLTWFGWIAGWLVAGPSRRLPAPRGGIGPTPPVSVVVPARNEAARLPALLGALAAEPVDARPSEVIVVDDGSTDGTAALASGGGATVLRTSPPPGWTGKAWACWQGAMASRGEVLVFLDADTEPAPGFVARLAHAAVESNGLVSVQPTHRVERPYEHLSAVCNVIALMAGTGPVSPRGRWHRWWRGPVGFGPAMAVPRALYFVAGGHAGVRGEVVDDLALAEQIDRRGLPVASYADESEGAVRYRMYPDGMVAVWRGWGKNLAAGAGRLPIVRTALVALWVAGALRTAAMAGRRPGLYGLYSLQAGVLFRRAGTFHPALAPVYPLPLAAFVVLMGRSIVARVARRPVSWRGRPVMP